MTKAEALAHWRKLKNNLPIVRHFAPIPYKAEGSRYGACGIRIDGSPEFIDAVLSRLKDVIELENDNTRLELARNEVDGSTLGKAFNNAENHAQVCYIRVHERGSEAKMVNAFIAGAKKRSVSK